MKKLCIVIPPDILDLYPHDYVYQILPQDYKEHFEITVIDAHDRTARDSAEEQIFADNGMRYIPIEKVLTEEYIIHPMTSFTKKAYGLYCYFSSHPYDFISFDCFGGLGFYTIQAKRTTDLFDCTTLSVFMSANSQWFADGNELWNKNPVADTCLWYAERYCAQHCDILTSPTQYMFDWTQKHAWNLAENRNVVSCRSVEIDISEPIKILNTKHLIFFGYLRVNSGVELFCSFIEKLVATNEVEKITFVGRDDWMYGYTTSHYIENRLQKQNIALSIQTDLDIRNSLTYIQKQNGVVFCPSAYANYSWQVAGCVKNSIVCLASDVGGNMEQLTSQFIFSPQISPLSKKWEQIKPLYSEMDYAVAEQKNDELTLKEWFFHSEPSQNEQIYEKIRKEKPLVSIGIPYYNHHEYLPMTLRAIDAIEYSNYEVIVVDDGSNLPISIETFESLQRQYNKENWHFIRKQNEYAGRTRNFSVENAKGEYVILVDSDNIVRPKMIDQFLFGMYKSGVDCLTCHFDTFVGKIEPDENTPIGCVMMPLGPIVELGFIDNIFGDTNFIMKKQCYQKVGGFPEERGLALDDWCLLAKFALKGYRQDVIPKQLFKYRVVDGSLGDTGNSYKSLKRIFDLYKDEMPPFVYFMIEGLVQPLYVKSMMMSNGIANSTTSGEELLRKLKRIFDRFCPQGSRRRKLVFWLVKKCKLI